MMRKNIKDVVEEPRDSCFSTHPTVDLERGRSENLVFIIPVGFSTEILLYYLLPEVPMYITVLFY
jgi:hypothetical protein